MAERGHEVTLVTIDPETGDFYDLPTIVQRVWADPACHLSCRWFDLACQIRRRAALRKSLLETRPDLVVSFLDTVNIGVLLALWGDDLSVIVSERIDPRHHAIGARWSLLRWLTYPRAARVVLLAEDSMEWAARFWPRWRVESIANPVFPTQHSPSVAARSAHHLVLGLGRLQAQKGFDLLIRAFASIADRFPEWQLVIFGDGPDRPALAELVKALGITGRVSLAGTTRDPFVGVSQDDLFVFSSRYEGFGMALAEAMAAGMPVISFDCPSGPGRIVRHEIDGLLVPPEDVPALASAMRRLMSDPAERARLASRAPEVTERFSPASIFDRWDRLIRDVLMEAA
jgi:GalNAc-alpha-(1->4)-GalNAc-alpha-(1->3)-diNAcBac-PP-undecaprenol alpha-1,4-N-acetyl-D-galactosaminyltransferase